MKKIEIALYKFEELGEDARRRAMDDARQWVGDTQAEIDDDVFYGTMEEMERVLGIAIEETSRGLSWRFTEMRWDDPDIWENPKYLMRYINWVQGRIPADKVLYTYYHRNQDKWTKRYVTYPKRGSAIISKGYDNCLTGEWTDETFDKWMTNAYDWVLGGQDIYDFVDSLVSEFKARWEEDREWGYSDDNVRDILEQNQDTDWYLEDGRKYDA